MRKENRPLVSGRRCTARTPRGQCRVTSGIDVNGLCLWHSPDRRGEAARIRSAGARKGARSRWEKSQVPPAPQTLDDAVKLASWLANAVLEGRVEPRRAAVAERVIASFVKGLQASSLADQVRALQAQLAKLRGGKEQP